MENHHSQRATRRARIAYLLAAVSVVACASDDDGGTPPGSTFEPFVLELFASTDATAEPTAINELEFTFGNDPAAFDALLD